MTGSTAIKSLEDAKKDYVLVDGSSNESTPETGSTATALKEELVPCPEIVYKVQYKDFTGQIKGNKLLDEPYKFKKTS